MKNRVSSITNRINNEVGEMLSRTLAQASH